jgi:hypothetical protein
MSNDLLNVFPHIKLYNNPFHYLIIHEDLDILINQDII